MVDYLRKSTGEKYVFAAAKQQVIWHYHWLIIYGYLHKMMDWDLFTRMLKEDSQYYTEASALPLEFSGAAFRAGHSQTREINRINEKVNKNLFELGFFGLMEEYVDWRYIFNFKDGRCELARLIDTKISPSFHDIPFIKSDHPLDRSLPFLNLKRGVIYGLPSGEDVARRMGYEPIDIAETKDLDLAGTPLWFYILREAEVLGHGGEHLGPVGSTILGECFFTIMCQDDMHFLKSDKEWTPTLGKKKCEFDFEDLINFVNL